MPQMLQKDPTMTIQCMITGVLLIDPEGDVCFPGDLFDTGDYYIVNCNEMGAHTPPEHLPRNLRWIRPIGDYWERRGVWVMTHDNAKLSIAALEYLGK